MVRNYKWMDRTLIGLFVCFDAAAIINTIAARGWALITMNVVQVVVFTAIIFVLWRESRGTM